MQKNIEEQQERVVECMDEKWLAIDALANASVAKDKKDGDNTKWLQQQIKSLDFQLGLKTNQNEADQKRLKVAKHSHEVRLSKILYAQRKAEQFKKMQAKLEAEAELANEAGASAKLERLKEDIRLLQQELANPTSERTKDEIASDVNTIKDYNDEIDRLEKAFAAKRKAEARDHSIARSVLPRQLKKQLPQPFSMKVELLWVDPLDAEYAAGNWPAAIYHDVLPLKATRDSVHYLNAAEYEDAVNDEVHGMVKTLERQALQDAGIEPYEPEPQVEEKTGVWKYLPEIKNPFKRADA